MKWYRHRLVALAMAMLAAGASGALAQTKPLEVTVLGGGRVVTTPAGIDCQGTGLPYAPQQSTVCSAQFDENGVVAVAYIPDTSVSESYADFTLTRSTAAAEPQGYTTATVAPFVLYPADTWMKVTVQAVPLARIALTVSGTGSGQVVSSRSGISCTSSCNGNVSTDPKNESTAYVTLTATPQAGSAFDTWIGQCTTGSPTQGTSGSSRWIQFTVDVNNVHGCEARFVTAPVLTVATAGIGVGTVTSSPSVISCRTGSSSNCSSAFAPGASVTLTAAPDPSYGFTGWSGGCSGTNTSVSLTLAGDATCTATFGPGSDPTITATINGTGTVTSSPAGISCTSGSCSTTISWDSSVTLTAAASGGNVFVEWTGDCSGSSPSVTLSNVRLAKACTARFSAPQQVDVTISGTGTVTSSPAGISCTSGTCSTTVAWDSSITLTAAASGGNVFVEWTGDCSGSSPSVTLSNVKLAKACTARFEAPQQVAVTLSGPGTVTSSPAGISCASGTCSTTIPWSTNITLTAATSGGSVFVEWTGDCTGSSSSVTLSDVRVAKACTAKFEAPRQVSVTISGPGAVTSSPAGISCASGTCSTTVPWSSSITLGAATSGSNVFVEWTGDCSGSSSSVTLSDVRVAKACTAKFEAPRQVTVTVSGEGSVTSSPAGINCPVLTCSTAVAWGGSLSLSATATGNWTFGDWGGACSGTTSAASLSNVRNDTSCSARFESPKNLTVSVTGTGVGQVSANVGGLVCSSGSCTVQYKHQQTVVLTAVARAGSVFESWGGSCSGTSSTATVVLTAAQTCTVIFRSDQKRLTVTLGGTGRGQVISVSSSIDCTDVAATSTCSATFEAGVGVALTAIPETPTTENPYDESRFDGWAGACSGSATTTFVTMSEAKDCSATFTKLKTSATLTVTLSGATSGTVVSTPAGITCTPTTLGRQCVARYAPDTAVSLSVMPEAGSRFIGWSGACSGRISPYPLTLTQSKACTANFSTGPIVPENGVWWNEAEGGRGYGLEVQYTNADPKIFFGTFAYTSTGAPIWYVSFLTPTDDGTAFSGPLTSYSGGQTLLGAYQPPTAPATVGVAGQTMKLTMTTPTEGTITFPSLSALSTGTSVAISRFPIVFGGLVYPKNVAPVLPQTGWWWSTVEPGRGILFEAQPDGAGNYFLFAMFFLYGTDGTPRWYFGSSALIPSAGSWAAPGMPFFECSGGQAIDSRVPAAAQCGPVGGGTTTVQFDATGALATMTLSTGAVVLLERFAF